MGGQSRLYQVCFFFALFVPLNKRGPDFFCIQKLLVYEIWQCVHSKSQSYPLNKMNKNKQNKKHNHFDWLGSQIRLFLGREKKKKKSSCLNKKTEICFLSLEQQQFWIYADIWLEKTWPKLWLRFQCFKSLK